MPLRPAHSYSYSYSALFLFTLAACNRSPQATPDASASTAASGDSSTSTSTTRAEHDAAFVSAATALNDLGAGDSGAMPAPSAAPATEPRPAFKKTTIEPAQLAKIFAQAPELVRIGSELRYFTEGDVRAMWTRTGASHEGITFTTTPIVWSPDSSAELLVATGRGKTMSFVVALWVLPDDRYRIASSFLMMSDLSPVALAFDPAHRKELRWTSCWGCPGEQGFVSFRPEEHRVVIVQQ